MMRPLSLILTLALVAGSVALFPPAARAQDTDHLKPTCDDSLQAAIDAADPWSTLDVGTECIYRESITIDKPLDLDGQGEAEIRGSDIWSEWIETDDAWVSEETIPYFETHGECEPGTDDRCLLAEQVFRDGVPLFQLSDNEIPGPGQFSVNDDGQIVLGQDPGSGTIEVTVRREWARVVADDVTIRGFTMKHAANDSQQGALVMDKVDNWTVVDNVISDAHGANVVFTGGRGGRLLDNELFNGGQLGFGGNAANTLVRGNSVHHNNTEAFSVRWESGGTKVSFSDGVTIEENAFFSNYGPGIWCDIDCDNTTIRNNDVYWNDDIGILFEISTGADISGNRVWLNGWGPYARGWAADSGIAISSSREANVYDNVVAWNGDGIAVISDCRAHHDDRTCNTSHHWNQVYGNHVHDNVIIMGGHKESARDVFALVWLRGIQDEDGDPFTYMFSPEADNAGYDNLYWRDDSRLAKYAWGDTFYTSLGKFNQTPGEENGRYLDKWERDELLSDAGIPLTPELPDDTARSSPPPSTLGNHPAGRGGTFRHALMIPHNEWTARRSVAPPVRDEGVT